MTVENKPTVMDRLIMLSETDIKKVKVCLNLPFVLSIMNQMYIHIYNHFLYFNDYRLSVMELPV